MTTETDVCVCGRPRFAGIHAVATPNGGHPFVSGEHAAQYVRHERGRSPVSGRSVYGWSVRCSCGWTQRTNEPKRYVERLFREHAKARAHSPAPR